MAPGLSGIPSLGGKLEFLFSYFTGHIVLDFPRDI